MANYIATDTDLTAVADAIRTKGGTSAQLSFPAGFVSAIGDISGGWVKNLSASFSQDDTRVFTTDELDDLRDRLTVTATYEDDTSEVVTAYELSGTLTAGTSTIVVSYGDKAATFTATVTEAVDITPAISSSAWGTGSSTTLVKNETDKSFLVYSTSNGTYKQLNYTGLTFEEGYGYRLSADCDYFAGDIVIGFSNSSGNVLASSLPAVQASGHFDADGILSEYSNYTSSGGIRLFITWSTSKAGRAVFRNIKLIKYTVATTETTLNATMGDDSA